mgnify:CR=1 FL=1
MYKIKVEKEMLLELEISGNLTTITAEVLASVMIVYQKLKQNDRLAAKQFKKNVEATIKSGIIFEDEENQKEILKQLLNDLKNELLKKFGKDGDEK